MERKRKRPEIAKGVWHVDLGIPEPTIKVFRFTEGSTYGFPFVHQNLNWYFVFSQTTGHALVICGKPMFMSYGRKIYTSEKTHEGQSLFSTIRRICENDDNGYSAQVSFEHWSESAMRIVLGKNLKLDLTIRDRNFVKYRFRYYYDKVMPSRPVHDYSRESTDEEDYPEDEPDWLDDYRKQRAEAFAKMPSKTKAEFFADRYSYTVPVQGHSRGFKDTAILLITNDEAGYKVTLTGKCFGSYSSVLPENYENRALADGLMSYWKKGKALKTKMDFVGDFAVCLEMPVYTYVILRKERMLNFEETVTEHQSEIMDQDRAVENDSGYLSDWSFSEKENVPMDGERLMQKKYSETDNGDGNSRDSSCSS